MVYALLEFVTDKLKKRIVRIKENFVVIVKFVTKKGSL